MIPLHYSIFLAICFLASVALVSGNRIAWQVDLPSLSGLVFIKLCAAGMILLSGHVADKPAHRATSQSTACLKYSQKWQQHGCCEQLNLQLKIVTDAK